MQTVVYCSEMGFPGGRDKIIYTFGDSSTQISYYILNVMNTTFESIWRAYRIRYF